MDPQTRLLIITLRNAVRRHNPLGVYDPLLATTDALLAKTREPIPDPGASDAYHRACKAVKPRVRIHTDGTYEYIPRRVAMHEVLGRPYAPETRRPRADGVIDLIGVVSSPHDWVSIEWECDGASGSTQCEAWRGQHEVDQLLRAGYVITGVTRA